MDINKSTLLIFIVTVSLAAKIVPPDNRINWTPGIPGGIPLVNSPIKNVVTDFGADKSGVTNALSAIQNGINSLSTSGGVLFFPEGEYRIDGSLKISNNDIVLRGEGSAKSRLNFYNPTNGQCIEIITYGRGDWQKASGYQKEATTITVVDGTKFTIGEFAEIQQENDSSFMYTNPEWNQTWAQDLVGQFFEVTAINGNGISLKTPFHISYKEKFNPVIRPQRLIKNVGIEELYISLNTNSDVGIILIKNSAYCWVKNVEFYYTAKAHIASESTLGCEIRGSKFSRSHNYGGGGHGYGVSLGLHTTDWLVEDNAFDSLRHAMIFSKGSNGNVFAYNYSLNVLQGEGETNLNTGWIPPDVSNHGHYAYMNLIESNSVQEIGISDYWGPSGPGNIYSRNRVLSGETTDGISYYDATKKQNVIGNSTITIRDSDGKAHDNIEHGNVVNASIVWDNTISDHNIPNSYYLTQKPNFFGEINWPLYGPVEGFNEKLPAQIRFEGGVAVIEKHISSVDAGWPEISIVQDRLIITGSACSLTLYTLSGRLVKSVLLKNKNTVSLQGLNPGFYIVKFKAGKMIKAGKLLRMK